MPPASDPTIEWIKIGVQILGYVVGWVLVLKGWSIAQKAQRASENRKEVRAVVEGLATLVLEVQTAAVAYFTEQGEIPLKASEWWILSSIDRISRSFASLKDQIGFDVSKEITFFKRSITLTDFGEAGRKTRTVSDPLIQKIGGAGSTLLSAIDRELTRIYPLSNK